MPIHLPEPAADRPADGKGWNRLSLNAHMGNGGAQCALRPVTYPAFIDSYNTMRAAWGGYGHCIRQQPGQCTTCPVLTRHEQETELIPVNAPRVLFRVEQSHPDGAMFHTAPTTRLWPTRGPADRDYRTKADPWSWGRLRRVQGWMPGPTHTDPQGPGLWMVRTSHAAAPHTNVHSRSWRTFTRHAFFVEGSRVALLTCHGVCRHPDGQFLNAVSHHCPEQPDPSGVRPYWDGLRGPAPASQLRITRTVNWGSVSLAVWDGRARIARLSLEGAGWGETQTQGAAQALLTHLGNGGE
ncbi:hypothetical protein [Streptomyces sp. NPDC047968]|uniref:hypothetical protein n=1 Tax=unclassified Streptomyces TaxID=2593676 RepID=UPI00341970B1